MIAYNSNLKTIYYFKLSKLLKHLFFRIELIDLVYLRLHKF